jgi:hypothetical protein
VPNRILREDILTSEAVNALSPEAELFYRRLMSVVDDFGRIEAHPQILLTKCYPFQLDRISALQVRSWLAESALEDRLITLYEVDGKNYLQINKFGQRERYSKCPSPPEARLKSAESALEAARASNSTSYSYSNSTVLEIKKKEECDFEFSDWFEIVYTRHPKKRDKVLASQVLSRLDQDGKLDRSLFDAVHVAWCASGAWLDKQGQYAPKLAEWVSDDGWKHPPPVDRGIMNGV